MKMTELTDEKLSEVFIHDEIGCKADSAIESRLNYAFMLKNSQHKVHQNSFFGSFASLFSLKHISIKAAFVSIVLIFSLVNFQKDGETQITPLIDTCMIMSPYSLDSANVHPISGDSSITKQNL